MVGFLEPGLDRGDPVIVAVPAPRLALLRDHLNDGQPGVELLDLSERHRNPGRIIPAGRARIAAHPGRQVYFVGEPIWPGLTGAEIRESTRHEALINLAWSDAPISVLCPYDTALPEAVIADACHTHPDLIDDKHKRPSITYTGPVPPPSCDAPLEEPSLDATTLRFTDHDLGCVRGLVAQHALAAGLDADRSDELRLAASELAANTIKHAGGAGVLRVWRTEQELICEIRDSGYITDPLAGRRAPTTRATNGLGLWIANQLCELVEMRSSTAGTTIRLHARLR